MNTVEVLVEGETVVLEQSSTTVLEIAAVGPQGPPGPDPWDEPIQQLSVSGAVTIDYSLGKHVELTLTGTVTSLAVSNWPATQRVARLTLEILNTGAFNIQSWPGVKWSDGGVLPSITPNGEDMIILTTINAGSRTYGHVVGQNYTIP